ncbi:MAG: Ig-like domain repeat protein [Vicinamibacterales bacterium]
MTYKAGTLTITKASTRLSLTSTASAAVIGQPVTLTAALAVQNPGSGHPSGTVVFTDGTTVIAGCAAQPVGPTGAATCATAALGIGRHSLNASYAGDGNFTASATTSALPLTVGKASTTTALAASPSPSVNAAPVTLTATLAVVAPGAGTPTGTVTFFDGTVRLGAGQLSVVGGRLVGTFSTSALGIGRHVITAAYGGDTAFATSTSAVLTHYVNTDISGFPRLANGAYNLTSVNLRGAYLVGVSLVGAKIDSSNFESAVLIGANLSGATITGSNFKSADFTSANLTGTTFSDTTTKGAIGLPPGR